MLGDPCLAFARLVYTHVRTHVYTLVRTPIYTHIRTNVYTHSYTCLQTRPYTCSSHEPIKLVDMPVSMAHAHAVRLYICPCDRSVYTLYMRLHTSSFACLHTRHYTRVCTHEHRDVGGPQVYMTPMRERKLLTHNQTRQIFSVVVELHRCHEVK